MTWRLIVLGLSLMALSSGQEADGPIVVQNQYWAKPGKAEEVYRWRLHASDVRVKLGLLRGRVLRRESESKTQPDVIWECEYPSRAARTREVELLDKSEEFKEVQRHMGTLTDKFDRVVLRE